MLGFMFDPCNVKTTKPLVQGVVSLLCLPDSTASRRSIALCEALYNYSLKDPRLHAAVGRDAFSAALSVLLKEEEWSEGMEWTFIDFMQEVYSRYVLGIDPNIGIIDPNANTASAPLTAPRNAAAASLNGSWVQGKATGYGHHPHGNSEAATRTHVPGIEQPGHLSPLPRQTMLLVPGVTEASLFELEVQLVKYHQVKKRRRDLFKDYISSLLRIHSDADTSSFGMPDLSAAPNKDKHMLRRPVPAALDVRMRMSKASAAASQRPQTVSTIDASSDAVLDTLFPDL